MLRQKRYIPSRTTASSSTRWTNGLRGTAASGNTGPTAGLRELGVQAISGFTLGQEAWRRPVATRLHPSGAPRQRRTRGPQGRGKPEGRRGTAVLRGGPQARSTRIRVGFELVMKQCIKQWIQWLTFFILTMERLTGELYWPMAVCGFCDHVLFCIFVYEIDFVHKLWLILTYFNVRLYWCFFSMNIERINKLIK